MLAASLSTQAVGAERRCCPRQSSTRLSQKAEPRSARKAARDATWHDMVKQCSPSRLMIAPVVCPPTRMASPLPEDHLERMSVSHPLLSCSTETWSCRIFPSMRQCKPKRMERQRKRAPAVKSFRNCHTGLRAGGLLTVATAPAGSSEPPALEGFVSRKKSAAETRWAKASSADAKYARRGFPLRPITAVAARGAMTMPRPVAALMRPSAMAYASPW
mmetsp:Transcript_39676/g.123650  ORF Transcript_39676/g.123650 Transcript_39676/m.123650 type:complete len:217 (-) Transcript_39676:190-840(-)